MKLHSVFAVLIITLLTACAHLGGNPAEKLEKQVTAYWQAKQDKKWGQAYDFYCPSVRTEEGKAQFVKTANLDITGFRIDGITFSEDGKQAQVAMVFNAMIQGYPFNGIKIKEGWSHVGDHWCIPEVDSFRSLFEKK